MPEPFSKADDPKKIIKCSSCKEKAVVSENDTSGQCDRCKAHSTFDGYLGSSSGDDLN